MNCPVRLIACILAVGALGLAPGTSAHAHEHIHTAGTASCCPTCSARLTPAPLAESTLQVKSTESTATPKVNRLPALDWDEPKPLDDSGCGASSFLETSPTSIHLSGYVDAGYLYNFTPAGSRVHSRSFETDALPKGDFDLHAINLLLGKPLPEENRLAAGFAFELAIGEDSAHEHIGDEEHGHGHDDAHSEESFSDQLHIHQAYGSCRLPVGSGLDFFAGKLHAPIGYEGCSARPYQLHITRSMVTRAEPDHLMGLMAVYPIDARWSAGIVISNTQDADSTFGLDTLNDAYAWTGYLQYQPADNFIVRAGFYLAPWGDEGFGMEENEPACVLNAYAQWRPLFARQRLLLVINATTAQFDHYSAEDSSSFYGVAGYARYQFSDLFSLGMRMEYVHTDDDQMLRLGNGVIDEHHAGSIDARSSDLFGVTVTAQVDLAEDMMLRFEYRFDSGDDIVNTTPQEDDSTFSSKDHAHTLAMQVVYQF